MALLDNSTFEVACFSPSSGATWAWSSEMLMSTFRNHLSISEIESKQTWSDGNKLQNHRLASVTSAAFQCIGLAGSHLRCKRRRKQRGRTNSDDHRSQSGSDTQRFQHVSASSKAVSFGSVSVVAFCSRKCQSGFRSHRTESQEKTQPAVVWFCTALHVQPVQQQINGLLWTASRLALFAFAILMVLLYIE